MMGVVVSTYPLPDYGDLFPFDEFLEMARSGGVSDDDGSAEWATHDARTTIPLSVSDVWRWARSEPPFTHVLWFNK